eukprot:CAMPEP_0168507816 /NCGR_PEP_ID=MMETSP0228-20121227/78068_1 /TAXON_ID=133427 /ORGANISM="Protoceratium reticulatum, Strain CCCM 535 (=CCMP 1889)" /LENGTH=42 /DNA_ID= /DNA_START= /DNA_END= /DNA_ORIENTATION=
MVLAGPRLRWMGEEAPKFRRWGWGPGVAFTRHGAVQARLQSR